MQKSEKGPPLSQLPAFPRRLGDALQQGLPEKDHRREDARLIQDMLNPAMKIVLTRTASSNIANRQYMDFACTNRLLPA